MNKKAAAAGTKGGRKFSTSLVIGLLLVPLSAVAAVALVNPDAEATPTETVAAEVVVDTTTSTTTADEIVMPEIASDDDLWEACGEQGFVLVTKEADGSISPLEQAALDSLRAICLSEGLELPGPPAPDAVVQTVTVVASPPPGTSSDSDDDSSSDETAAEFEAAYAATVAHINKAIADGASGEKIAQAERYLAEAATLADAGDYDSGMDKLSDAREAADAATRGGHHDDDDYDDDHDDDDDDHDEEDDEDDEDEEDEDDEEDEEDEEDEDEDDD